MGTVEEHLREGGFQGFHKLIVAVTGFAWTFVAMEVLLVGFTLPIFQEIWDLSGLSLGLIGSAALIGSFMGSLVWGWVADRIGRRPVFQSVVLWYSVFIGLTALSWDPSSLFVFRLLAGIGLGGMLVVDPSLLAEYLPPQVRGRFMVFLDFFWPIGFTMAIGLAYYFLNILEGEWRLLFLAAAFPAFLAFLFRFFVPESPFFLARSGRMDEAARVISKLIGKTVTAESIREEVAVRGRMSELFKGTLLLPTTVIIVTWMALNFSYYGLFLWLPSALSLQGVRIGDVYLFLLLSAGAQFPGYLASMWLVEAWGRKKTLFTFLLLGGLSGYVFATAANYPSFIAGLFFVSFFNLGAWGAVYPFTSETFPTVLRASGFGVAEGAGKITAIFGPAIFGLLLDITGEIIVPLTVVAIVMGIGGITGAALARETKGSPLR